MLRLLSKLFFVLMGWKLHPTSPGQLPDDTHRCVMIASPHTSNWDIVYARAAFALLGLPVKFTIKKEWMSSPIGPVLRALGAIGIDRSPKEPGSPRPSMTDAMAALFAKHDRLVVLVTPEGTRKLRTSWKSGFYYIAKKAGVPVALGFLDYKKKVAGVGPLIYLTENYAADMHRIQLFYKDIAPKFPEKFSPDLETLNYTAEQSDQPEIQKGTGDGDTQQSPAAGVSTGRAEEKREGLTSPE